MSSFCEDAALAYPRESSKYLYMAELYGKKLWHQLTMEIFDFVLDKSNCHGDSFVKLYIDFISLFESRMNQLKLAQIVCAIASTDEDKANAAALLTSALEKSARLGPEPSLLLRSELGLTNLRRGVLDGIKEQITQDKATLDDLDSIADTSIHSAYYLLASEYYKGMGPPQAFFSSALMYLAYTPLEGLTPERQQELATDISLAAITADGVFNFGEVVSTAAVKALSGTRNAWLGSMLDAFNKGDIDAFAKISVEHSQEMINMPILVERAGFIKDKISLMCLVNMIFEIPSHQRDISFLDIANRTHLPLDQVEWLLMRAMSLGLMKGLMDEVAQIVHVSWVQPRVLDKVQIGHLEARLESWKCNVTSALHFMESQTPELFG